MAVVSRVIFLNNAAGSWPKAPGVAETVKLALDNPPFHPGRAEGSGTNALDDCRRALAALLGVTDPGRIVLTSGATHALNIAIGGLGLSNDANVVTTVTEHNSVLRPLNHLAQHGRVSVSYVGLDENGDLDAAAFDRAMEDSPRLVVINHASNVTGRVIDAAEFFAKAKAAGAVTLLDASQSLGLMPVNAPAMNADMVAFTGHKGLRGPAGTGGLYVSPEIDLEQVIVGGTGVRSDLELHPSDMPMRLEAGTPNGPAFAGLAHALRWHSRFGELFAREGDRLARKLRHSLAHAHGIRVFDSGDQAPRTHLVSLGIDGWSVADAGSVLSESFGIVCRTGLHCAPLIHEAIGSAPEGSVRFSVSGANTDDEIEQVVYAVRRLAA